VTDLQTGTSLNTKIVVRLPYKLPKNGSTVAVDTPPSRCDIHLRMAARRMLGLQVRQVDLHAPMIRLDPGITKNGESREVVMTPEVEELLRAAVAEKKPTDSVFTRDDGKPIKDFRSAWRNPCVRAGTGRWECRKCWSTLARGEMRIRRRPQARWADPSRLSTLRCQGLTPRWCTGVGHHGDGRVEDAFDVSSVRYRE
jgi:integrase